jgi:hypothetical protein
MMLPDAVDQHAGGERVVLTVPVVGATAQGIQPTTADPTKLCTPGIYEKKNHQQKTNKDTIKSQFVAESMDKDRVDACFADPNVKKLRDCQRNIKGKTERLST